MLFGGKLKINNHVQSKSTNCTQILSAFADLNVNKGNCHITIIIIATRVDAVTLSSNNKLITQ